MMASISYPTKLELDGPWFFDLRSLNALDERAKSAFDQMCERRTQAIAQVVQERKATLISEGKDAENVESLTDHLKGIVGGSYEYSNVYVKVRVNLQDGGTVEGLSFAEIAVLPRMQNATPIAFSVVSQSGPTRFEVALRPWGSGSLSILVEGKDSQLCEDVFGQLESWASLTRTPRWVSQWRDLGWLSWALLYFWLFVSVLLFSFMSAPHPSRSITHEQAYNLAKQGVTPETETKALQLILAIESGYEPSPIAEVRHYPSRQFYVYVILGTLIFTSLLFPPKGAIGLWAGKKRLDRQRYWLKIVTISFPGFLLATVVIPFVSHLLGW